MNLLDLLHLRPKPPPSIFLPRTPLANFLHSPIRFLAQTLYPLLLRLHPGPDPTSPSPSGIRVVCISDTHTKTTSAIPRGDLLIHAGDLTNSGSAAEIQAQLDWLRSLSFQHTVFVAGNHDAFFDQESRRAEDRAVKLDTSGLHYLEDSSVTLEFPDHGGRTLKVYGSPHVLRCGGSDFAFQYGRAESKSLWRGRVLADADVLVTHSPPAWHRDLPAGLGDAELLEECWRVRPRLHVFGHVHAGAGKEVVGWGWMQRVYEAVCRRPVGGLAELLDFGGWVALGAMALLGVLEGALGWVLRGRRRRARGGWMVNAALSVADTGRLGNPVQVVYL